MPAPENPAGTLSLSPDIPHDTGVPDQREGSGTDLPIRALATPFTRTSLQQLEDGDLLIKGVPMLAEGTWTDSAVGTPLFYPAKTLSEYATNWSDKSGWNRHLGGVPRRGTDKVGEAENIRFENGAVTADVRVYGFTQNGRDMQEMIKRKLISFVSVEHGGNERFNPATRQMEANTLLFHGFAFVNRGACKVCRLNETASPVKDPAPSQVAEPVEDTMDTKELEDKIATLTKELEAVKAQKPAEVKVEVPKELAELPGQVKALADQVKELASKPANPVTAAAGEIKELEEPEFVAYHDKRTGSIRSA